MQDKASQPLVLKKMKYHNNPYIGKRKISKRRIKSH
jgi:hypothetical protein